MAIIPHEDIQTVIKTVADDKYIQSLGFKREKMYNTMTVDELLENEQKQMFFYFVQSQEGMTDLSVRAQFQIDVSVPISEASKAQRAAAQIIALLNGKRINGHAAMRIVPPTPCSMACQYGFECIGIRFSYPVTVYNEIKTV